MEINTMIITETRITHSMASLLDLPGGEEKYSFMILAAKIMRLCKERLGKKEPFGYGPIYFDADMRAALNIPVDEVVTIRTLSQFLRPHYLDLEATDTSDSKNENE